MAPHVVARAVFPDADLDEFLQLSRGPGVEILVGPRILYGDQNQDPRTWCISKALISYHSGLFKIALSGPQAQSKIIIDDDYDIFGLFHDYMMRGRYTWRDDLRSHDGIRESAKAWALGAKLQAPKFQNLAMHNLYDIFKPSNRLRPRSAIGPYAMEWVCENLMPGEALFDLYRDVLFTHWGDQSVVVGSDNDWDEIWKMSPGLQNGLFRALRVPGDHILPLQSYLVEEESEPVNDDADVE